MAALPLEGSAVGEELRLDDRGGGQTTEEGVTDPGVVVVGGVVRVDKGGLEHHRLFGRQCRSHQGNTVVFDNHLRRDGVEVGGVAEDDVGFREARHRIDRGDGTVLETAAAGSRAKGLDHAVIDQRDVPAGRGSARRAGGQAGHQRGGDRHHRGGDRRARRCSRVALAVLGFVFLLAQRD